MKAKVATICGLLFLALTFTTFLLAQQCTDCNQQTKTCLPPKAYCACSCFSHVINGVRYCTASGACGGHQICPSPPPLTTQTMMNFPWLANTGIAKELATHSTMPNAMEIFEEVRAVQLRDGANSIRRGYAQDSGYRLDGDAPTVASNKTKGTQWWQLTSDDSQKTQVLTLWDDPDLKWITTGDIHHSKLRLPVTETITFYPDHWQQVNANGVFTHSVEAFVPLAKTIHSSPLIAEDTLTIK
jgi:hypothetical protein